MKRTSVLLFTLLALPGLAFAHGPSRQKVEKSVTVAAPAAKAWAVVADFCAIEKWNPAVAKCEGTGGNEPGATRVLTLNDAATGPKIHNELVKYDAEKMSYRYKITENDVNVFPVTTYSAEVSVSAIDDASSKVTLKAGFYRGYTNNDPPPELNDEAAVKAVSTTYDAALARIKELAEAP